MCKYETESKTSRFRDLFEETLIRKVPGGEDIMKKLQTEAVGRAIADYAQKLRKTQRVEVLITRVAS